VVDSTAGRDGPPDAGDPSLLEPALLELEGITKRFPGVFALDAVPFDLRAGEVHVLFGENGAGKSTLISIVAGALRPESGTVKLRGEPIELGSVHHARSLGISAVFQEFSLVPQLTIEQNTFSLRALDSSLDEIKLPQGIEDIVGVVSQRSGSRRSEHKRYDT
jgi:ABC-type sugar transport system ATPase subunit